MLAISQSFTGPIPPPSVLGAYTPEIQAKIVGMAEIQIEVDEARGEREAEARGQKSATALGLGGLLAIVAVMIAAPNGAGATAAAAIAGGVFAPMAYALICGRKAQSPPEVQSLPPGDGSTNTD